MAFTNKAHHVPHHSPAQSPAPAPTAPNGFSPERYRQAMGPGYQAAMFSDQPSLTASVPVVTAPVVSPRLAARPWLRPLLARLGRMLSPSRPARDRAAGPVLRPATSSAQGTLVLLSCVQVVCGLPTSTDDLAVSS